MEHSGTPTSAYLWSGNGRDRCLVRLITAFMLFAGHNIATGLYRAERIDHYREMMRHAGHERRSLGI